MTENKNGLTGLVLTAEQIKSLAKFAEEDGQPKYCITHTTIPAFTAEDDRDSGIHGPYCLFRIDRARRSTAGLGITEALG